MGARPLRRAIQRYIEDPLADFVLRAELHPGATVVVDAPDEGDDGEVSLSIVEPKTPSRSVPTAARTLPTTSTTPPATPPRTSRPRPAVPTAP